jgi:hypothetical protein
MGAAGLGWRFYFFSCTSFAHQFPVIEKESNDLRVDNYKFCQSARTNAIHHFQKALSADDKPCLT